MGKPIFENKMKVRDYECDAQGVVNNANYQHYFEHTRHEFMESCGIKLRDLTEANIIPMVREINIKYKASLCGSDEFICTAQIERKGVRYYFIQKIYRIPDNILCTEARVEVACLINGKIAEPIMFDKAFTEYITWI